MIYHCTRRLEKTLYCGHPSHKICLYCIYTCCLLKNWERLKQLTEGSFFFTRTHVYVRVRENVFSHMIGCSISFPLRLSPSLTVDLHRCVCLWMTCPCACENCVCVCRYICQSFSNLLACALQTRYKELGKISGILFAQEEDGVEQTEQKLEPCRCLVSVPSYRFPWFHHGTTSRQVEIQKRISVAWELPRLLAKILYFLRVAQHVSETHLF